MWIPTIANGNNHGRQSPHYIDNHDNHAFLKVYLYIFILISSWLPWLSSVFLATNSTNSHLSDSLQPFPPPTPLQCCYKFSLARRKIRRRFPPKQHCWGRGRVLSGRECWEPSSVALVGLLVSHSVKKRMFGTSKPPFAITVYGHTHVCLQSYPPMVISWANTDCLREVSFHISLIRRLDSQLTYICA